MEKEAIRIERIEPSGRLDLSHALGDDIPELGAEQIGSFVDFATISKEELLSTALVFRCAIGNAVACIRLHDGRGVLVYYVDSPVFPSISPNGNGIYPDLSARRTSDRYAFDRDDHSWIQRDASSVL